MVALLGLFILFTSSITVFVGAAYPCDTATAYQTQFLLCYATSQIYQQSLNLNTIYRNYDSFTLTTLIPPGWSDTDPDGIKACGEGIEDIRSCMSDAYASCEGDVRLAVAAEIDLYRARLCESRDGTWVWSELSITYFQSIAVGFSSFSTGDVACISNVFLIASLEENNCYSVELVTAYSFMGANSLVALNGRMGRIYTAYYSCLYRQMIITQCDDEFAVGYFAYMAIFQFVGVSSFGVIDLDRIVRPFVVSSLIRWTSGAFGDPHVEGTDGEDSTFKTCSAVGERIFLSNTYVLVTGTNTAVAGTSGQDNPPTFTTAVTVKFFDDTYNEVAVYSAGSTVPTTFDNGQTTITETSGAKDHRASIDLVNGAIRLRYTRGGIVISIKKVGQGLNMKIRMADSLYQAASGDLIYGCLGSEVDTDAVTRRRREAPSTTCVDAGVKGNQLQACEYDLLVTGDETVVNETYSSLAELDILVVELDEEMIQTTTTTTGRITSGTGGDTLVPQGTTTTVKGTAGGSGVDALVPHGLFTLCVMVAGYVSVM